jgi:hypothetical protein
MKQLPEHGLCSIPTLFFTNVAQELYIRLINIYLPERLYSIHRIKHFERREIESILCFWPPLPWWGLRLKGNIFSMQCFLFSVVFTPSPPATTAAFGSYLPSLYSNTAPPVRACSTNMMGEVLWGPKRRRSWAALVHDLLLGLNCPLPFQLSQLCST